MLNSSIKKHMSDVAAMLTCSKYFLGHSRLHLTGAEDTKATSVESVSAGGTFAEDVSESTCMGVGLSSASC